MSTPNVAGRRQQIVPAGLVLALSIWIGFASFSVSDPEPYLFPRLISVLMIGLSLAAFIRALRGTNRTGAGLDSHTFINVIPGLALMCLFVFALSEWLGFYVASTLIFLGILSVYDPAEHTSLRIWMKRLIITAGFMTVLYCVFALLLRVQTPRGLFF